MNNPDRPQAPGYLANLMARLFHELSGEGLAPLGIDSAMFPLLVELWFGDAPVTRASLRASQEMEAAGVDRLVISMVEAGLVERAGGPQERLKLTARGEAAKGPAIAAARTANAAAAAALNEDEMATFVAMMNRVIDRLLAAKRR